MMSRIKTFLYGLALIALAAVVTSQQPPPAKAQQTGSVYCSQSAFFDGAAGNAKLVDGGTSSIVICGYDVSASAAGTIQLKTGTPGNNCAAPTGNITPNWNLVAGVANFGAGNFVGIGPVPRNTDICVTTATAPTSQIHLYYARQ